MADCSWLTPHQSRVTADGRTGTVQSRDGGWVVVLFDGETFAELIHVDDLNPASAVS